MALSITHLGLNEINQHVDGNTGPLYNITDNADLNSNDVRVWGSLYHDSTYSSLGPLGPGGSAAAGINTTSETEISMGEFRNAEAPTAAFTGTMTSGYTIIPGGDYYIPSSYYSGYVDGARGSHTNKTFAGTLGGVYSSQHTLHLFQNSGLGTGSGIINIQWRNARPAATTPYNASATDWTSVTVGSTTFNRTDASSTYAGSNTNYYYYQASWGRYYPTPQIFYSLGTYFGTTATNFSMSVNLT